MEFGTHPGRRFRNWRKPAAPAPAPPAPVVRPVNQEVKQVIVINRGLSRGMPRGKEIAQGAHAAMAFLTSRMEILELDDYTGMVMLTPAEREWILGGFTKVVVQVSSLEELLELHETANAACLEAHLITDSGRTVFHDEPTITALAIGPDYADEIDKITGDLKLY